MHFVDQVYLSVKFSEFIFGVNQYQASFGSLFGAESKQFARIMLQFYVIFFAHQALRQNFLP